MYFVFNGLFYPCGLFLDRIVSLSSQVAWLTEAGYWPPPWQAGRCMLLAAALAGWPLHAAGRRQGWLAAARCWPPPGQGRVPMFGPVVAVGGRTGGVGGSAASMAAPAVFLRRPERKRIRCDLRTGHMGKQSIQVKIHVFSWEKYLKWQKIL
jgi:hypothetical protein